MAGVSLPRVAQDQYDATPKLAAGHAARAGRPRLLRRRAARASTTSGLFVGVVGAQDVMVDAPHSGADVRADAFLGTPGASFGNLVYVGGDASGLTVRRSAALLSLCRLAGGVPR